MVLTDSHNRSHYEKTNDLWVKTCSNNSIAQAILICSKQILSKKKNIIHLTQPQRGKLYSKLIRKTFLKEDVKYIGNALQDKLIQDMYFVSNNILNNQNKIRELREQYLIDTGKEYIPENLPEKLPCDINQM
jgi:hypothetical protein